MSINWYLLAGLSLAAWFIQNNIHELSHLIAGWIWEGRKPTKYIPFPHVYKGYWFWSRYECGEATKKSSEINRLYAPLWGARSIYIIYAIIYLSVSPTQDESFIVYASPFLGAPIIDTIVWYWGYFSRRPLTDGARYRELKKKGK